MENIILLVVGVFMSVIGIVNMTGNISTVHSYNRRKVRDADVKKYGRAVGIGTLVIGLSVILNYILILLELKAAMPFVLIPAVTIGVAFILYAQFKYNKGIF